MNAVYSNLCLMSTLEQAWQIVLQKQSAGGIDDVSLEDYRERLGKNLLRLQKALSERTWKPQPYMGISVPKNDSEKRELGLLSVEDKIVQQAIKILIEPVFEKRFYNCSYAYRVGKGHQKAIRRVVHECCQKKNQWILRLDIDDFFDTIDRDILFKRLTAAILDSELRRIIELCVTMGKVDKSMEWTEQCKGIPQGAVLSPLLANFYLTSFDQFVCSVTDAYVRYADDFIVWCETKEEAENMHSRIAKHLKKHLHLTLNEPQICHTSAGIEYLGIVVTRNKVSISQEKQNSILSRLRSIEIKDNRLSKRYVQSVQGVHRYYARVLPESYSKMFCDTIKGVIEGWIGKNPSYSVKDLERMFHGLPLFGNSTIEDDKELLRIIRKAKADAKDGRQDVAKDDKMLNRKLVRSRKLEYRRRENDNSELVVSSHGYFIGVSNRGITLRKNGNPVSVPPSAVLKHISVISDGVSISSNAVKFCMANNIAIDFFDNHSTHIASVVSPKYLLTTNWQLQGSLSEERRLFVAKQIIIGKLKNQLNLMKYFNKYHKNVISFSREWSDTERSVKEVIRKINDIDDLAQYRMTLMGYEAQGAVIYWEYIRDLINDDVTGFECRQHHGATDLVNSMLNYAYAILYPRVWQALLVNKLNPYMGFVHYQEGNANLVFDMIELFRSQAADRVVISMIQRKEPLSLNHGMLSDSTKSLLAKNVLERLQRYEKYRGEERKFNNIIEMQAKELVDYMKTGAFYRPYIAKW